MRKKAGSFHPSWVGQNQNFTDVAEKPDAKAFAMTYDEAMNFLRDKEVYATFENYFILRGLRYNRTVQLKEITEQIIAALEALD